LKNLTVRLITGLAGNKLRLIGFVTCFGFCFLLFCFSRLCFMSQPNTRPKRAKTALLEQNDRYGWIMLPLYNNANTYLEKHPPPHAFNYWLEYTHSIEIGQSKLSGRS